RATAPQDSGKTIRPACCCRSSTPPSGRELRRRRGALHLSRLRLLRLAAITLVACTQSQEFSSVLEPAPPPETTGTEPQPAPSKAPRCTVGQCTPTVIAH